MNWFIVAPTRCQHYPLIQPPPHPLLPTPKGRVDYGGGGMGSSISAVFTISCLASQDGARHMIDELLNFSGWPRLTTPSPAPPHPLQRTVIDNGRPIIRDFLVVDKDLVWGYVAAFTLFIIRKMCMAFSPLPLQTGFLRMRKYKSLRVGKLY